MIVYLITDPFYYTSDPECFAVRLEKAIAMLRPTHILVRDKSGADVAALVTAAAGVLVRYPQIAGYVSGDIAVALDHPGWGVHLTSRQFDRIAGAKARGLSVIVSCHTASDVATAENAGADMVTLSPVFASPGKGDPVGLDKLNEIAGTINVPVIALGGIVTPDHIRAVSQTKAAGFASIRYFTHFGNHA